MEETKSEKSRKTIASVIIILSLSYSCYVPIEWMVSSIKVIIMTFEWQKSHHCKKFKTVQCTHSQSILGIVGK